jgi:transposase
MSVCIFATRLDRRGNGLHRQLTDLGHVCDVVAPTMIPKRSGDRVKTNRRDSVTLVKLLRAGELRAIWVPDSVHEAVRDLTRAREVAMIDLKKKRQQLLSFLLRYGRIFPGRKNWTKMHERWLAADLDRYRPPFRNDVAHHSEIIPPTVPR